MKKFRLILVFVLFLLFIVSATVLAEQLTITWWINPWRIAPPGFSEDQAPSSEDFPKWISEEFEKSILV